MTSIDKASAAISARNLTLTLGTASAPVPILKGIDLSVPAGEIHAIMGPNGSGKSTLGYVLSGRDDYTVTGGTVTFNGQDMLAMAPEARLDVFNILDQKLLNLNPDYYSYTLGKAALMTLTEIWRRSGHANIRVFGLAPGLMFPSGPQTQERFLADSAKIPTGRATPPEHICAAIGFFLAHPEQPGQIWPLDGGEHLAPRRRDIAFE